MSFYASFIYFKWWGIIYSAISFHLTSTHRFPMLAMLVDTIMCTKHCSLHFMIVFIYKWISNNTSKDSLHRDLLSSSKASLLRFHCLHLQYTCILYSSAGGCLYHRFYRIRIIYMSIFCRYIFLVLDQSYGLWFTGFTVLSAMQNF